MKRCWRSSRSSKH